eukprot:TRINITY_DN44519_c0_g1_i1.p1 TRINITY_DN44519_c0_g1~~TRINITY_DN44519_c0_g1_i1.p1  ORF type:complete len:345 (+),score=93.11 TRINITY_DN44519_c0_g1_i1:127-1161(+)
MHKEQPTERSTCIQDLLDAFVSSIAPVENASPPSALQTTRATVESLCSQLESNKRLVMEWMQLAASPTFTAAQRAQVLPQMKQLAAWVQGTVEGNITPERGTLDQERAIESVLAEGGIHQRTLLVQGLKVSRLLADTQKAEAAEREACVATPAHMDKSALDRYSRLHASRPGLQRSWFPRSMSQFLNVRLAEEVEKIERKLEETGLPIERSVSEDLEKLKQVAQKRQALLEAQRKLLQLSAPQEAPPAPAEADFEDNTPAADVTEIAQTETVDQVPIAKDEASEVERASSVQEATDGSVVPPPPPPGDPPGWREHLKAEKDKAIQEALKANDPTALAAAMRMPS